jgi:hypothetical protein
MKREDDKEMPKKLTAQQSIDIAGDCVRQVTHSHRPLNLADQLLLYGVFTQQQTAAVRNNVVANGVIGVPRFNFSLDPTFLITLSSSTTLGQLVGTIRQNSVPNQAGLVLGMQGLNDSEHFAVASMHLAAAAESLSASASKSKQGGRVSKATKKVKGARKGK